MDSSLDDSFESINNLFSTTWRSFWSSTKTALKSCPVKFPAHFKSYIHEYIYSIQFDRLHISGNTFLAQAVARQTHSLEIPSELSEPSTIIIICLEPTVSIIQLIAPLLSEYHTSTQ